MQRSHFTGELNQRFGLRKYKMIGLCSAVLGTMMLTAFANPTKVKADTTDDNQAASNSITQNSNTASSDKQESAQVVQHVDVKDTTNASSNNAGETSQASQAGQNQNNNQTSSSAQSSIEKDDRQKQDQVQSQTSQAQTNQVQNGINQSEANTQAANALANAAKNKTESAVNANNNVASKTNTQDNVNVAIKNSSNSNIATSKRKIDLQSDTAKSNTKQNNAVNITASNSNAQITADNKIVNKNDIDISKELDQDFDLLNNGKKTNVVQKDADDKNKASDTQAKIVQHIDVNDNKQNNVSANAINNDNELALERLYGVSLKRHKRSSGGYTGSRSWTDSDGNNHTADYKNGRMVDEQYQNSAGETITNTYNKNGTLSSSYTMGASDGSGGSTDTQYNYNSNGDLTSTTQWNNNWNDDTSEVTVNNYKDGRILNNGTNSETYQGTYGDGARSWNENWDGHEARGTGHYTDANGNVYTMTAGDAPRQDSNGNWIAYDPASGHIQRVSAPSYSGGGSYNPGYSSGGYDDWGDDYTYTPTISSTSTDYDSMSVHRTITVDKPHGGSKDLSQSGSLSKSRTVNHWDDGHTTYDDWSGWNTYYFGSVSIPQIAGYTSRDASGKATTSVAGATANSSWSDPKIHIHYTANPQSVLYNFVDTDANAKQKDQIVSHHTYNGVTDQTINFGSDSNPTLQSLIPQNYELAQGQTLSSNYTFGVSNPTVTIRLVHQRKDITGDPTQKQFVNHFITRTVMMDDINGNRVKTLAQTKQINRTATLDLVTGSIAYGPWSKASMEKVDVPHVVGYTSNYEGGVPEEDNCSEGYRDPKIEVTYQANNEAVRYSFVDDETNDSEIKHTDFRGVTKQTIPVSLTLPDNYELAKGQTLPTSYQFYADDKGYNKPILIYMVHHRDNTTVNDPKAHNTVTRKVTFIEPKYDTQGNLIGTQNDVRTQSWNFVRTAIRDAVTGTTQYQAWSTEGKHEFDAIPAPKVIGYTPDKTIDQIAMTPGQPEIDETVKYTPDRQQIDVVYINPRGKEVGRQTLFGHSDEDVVIPYRMPQNYYKYGDLQKSYHFKASDNQNLIVNVDDTYTNLPQDTHTVTRNIQIVDPDGTIHTQNQSFTFARNAIKDDITGEISYGKWNQDTHYFGQVRVPKIWGYNPSGDIPAITVKPNDTDYSIRITYKANSHDLGINYVTRGGDVVGRQTITGLTNQTKSINYEAPKGWRISKDQDYDLPTSYKFTAVDAPDYDVIVEHAYNTVSMDPVTVTRIVTITEPNKEPNTTKQTVTFTGTKEVDSLTGKTVSVSWSENGKHVFEEVDAPTVNGYAINGSAPQEIVTPDSKDETINITYTGNAMQTYWHFIDADDNNKEVGGKHWISGRAGETYHWPWETDSSSSASDDDSESDTGTVAFNPFNNAVSNSDDGMQTFTINAIAPKAMHNLFDASALYGVSLIANPAASASYGTRLVANTAAASHNNGDVTIINNPTAEQLTPTTDVQLKHSQEIAAKMHMSNVPEGYYIVGDLPKDFTFDPDNTTPPAGIAVKHVRSDVSDSYPGAKKTITRKINVVGVDGKTTQQDESVTFSRKAVYDHAENAIALGKWDATTKVMPAYPISHVDGYTIVETSTDKNGNVVYGQPLKTDDLGNGLVPEAVADVNKGLGDNAIANVGYKANNQTSYYQFIDDTENGKAFGKTNFSGNTNQKVNLTIHIPTNYELVKGQQVPATYTFSPKDNAPINIHVTHIFNTLAKGDSVTVTRTIVFNKPDKPETQKQTVTFTRSTTTDNVTKEVTYGAWSENGKHEFGEVTIPAVKGYKPSRDKVEKAIVTPDTKSSTITVNYSVAYGKQSFEYDDGQGKKIGDQTVNGQIGDTISVTPKLPHGWVLQDPNEFPKQIEIKDVNVPYKFTVTHKIDHIDHNHPVNEGDAIPDGDGAKYPSGLAKDDLNHAVTRDVNITNPLTKKVNKIHQEADFYRDADYDEVTQKITYSKWQTKDKTEFAEVDAPKVDGYKPNCNAPKMTVTADTKNSVINIDYTKLPVKTVPKPQIKPQAKPQAEKHVTETPAPQTQVSVPIVPESWQANGSINGFDLDGNQFATVSYTVTKHGKLLHHLNAIERLNSSHGKNDNGYNSNLSGSSNGNFSGNNNASLLSGNANSGAYRAIAASSHNGNSNSNADNQNANADSLPQTGETNDSLMALIGFTITAIGIIGLDFSKRKKA